MENQGFYQNYYTQIDSRGFQWRELGGAAKAANIVGILGETRVDSILDIGCGTGAVLHGLEEKGLGTRYYALDVAEEAVAYTGQRSDLKKLVEANTFDGKRIPYGDQAFDLAILSHVIEHLKDPGPLLKESARVAKYVVVEVPLEANLYTWMKVKVLKSRYREEIGHIQWFSARSFRSLLENQGHLTILMARAAYIPDELYYFRKKGFPLKLTGLQILVRKALRLISADLYLSLLTDHYIALVKYVNENPGHS